LNDAEKDYSGMNFNAKCPYKFAGAWGYYDGSGRGSDQTADAMVLCGHRFYSPGIARWLTEDPIGFAAGINRYGYCDNRPTSVVDPGGLDGVHVWGDIRLGSPGEIILDGSIHLGYEFGITIGTNPFDEDEWTEPDPDYRYPGDPDETNLWPPIELGPWYPRRPREGFLIGVGFHETGKIDVGGTRDGHWEAQFRLQYYVRY
jgi:RHS repeat-associated protein